MQLSVIICAYNPNLANLNRVLAHLKAQSLPQEKWELIIVDNNSSNGFQQNIDLSWHPEARIIKEKKQGLIHARIAGNHTAKNDYIVTVDDDTLLDPEYLKTAYTAFLDFPQLGIMGGRSVAEFEEMPPEWVHHFDKILCIKDLGESIILTKHEKGKPLQSYPSNGPFLIAYRKAAFNESFLPHFQENQTSQNLGRKGKSLASGEDNDIVLSIYKAGYEVGYFPGLLFTHIIPAKRYTKEYLARLVRSSNKSWIQVQALHGIQHHKPIPAWTLPIRKIRAYFNMKAWQSPASYIKWQGACGTFEGQATLNQ